MPFGLHPFLLIAPAAIGLMALLVWIWRLEKPSGPASDQITLPPPVIDRLGLRRPDSQQRATTDEQAAPTPQKPARLSIEYTDQDGTITMRALTIIGLVGDTNERGFFPHTIEGYCHLRQAPRQFKTQRIRLMKDPFTDFGMLESTAAIAGTLRILAGPAARTPEDEKWARWRLEEDEAKRTIHIENGPRFFLEWRPSGTDLPPRRLEAEIIGLAKSEQRGATSLIARNLHGQPKVRRYFRSTPVPLVRTLLAAIKPGYRMEADEAWEILSRNKE